MIQVNGKRERLVDEFIIKVVNGVVRIFILIIINGNDISPFCFVALPLCDIEDITLMPAQTLRTAATATYS